MIHGIDGTTLNGVTITSGTTYSVDGGQQQLPHRRPGQPGNDPGRRQRQPGASSTPIANGGTINLSGGGTINLNDPNSYLLGYNGNETLVNMDNTIQGQGYIYQLGSFQNQGTVDANVPRAGRCRSTRVPTTNTGTLEATGGGTLQIYASTVTNTGYTISTDSYLVRHPQ